MTNKEGNAVKGRGWVLKVFGAIMREIEYMV